MEKFEELKRELIKGNIAKVKEIVQGFVDASLAPKEILDSGLIAGMDVIGERFKKNEIFIPEVMIAAKAMHEGMNILEPYLARHGVKPVGKVIIGTVKGDLHDIGKNIVGMMLKGAGFGIEDFGIDVAPERFVDYVASNDVDILAMSTLLTTAMPFMKETIRLLKEKKLDNKVKTMVGGAPVTQTFAESIGADAYGKDASSAVSEARELLGIKV